MVNLLSCLFLVILTVPQVFAHQSTTTYLGNEAVLITNGDKKVLFDPFFHQAFGAYQLVPEHIKKAIFAATPPFDNVTAIVISHAHDDHFAAGEVLKYLLNYSKTVLIAPLQAVTKLRDLPDAQAISSQVVSVSLALNDPAKKLQVAGLQIEVVRIPHAGWPGRAEVENMVFRVTLEDENTPVTIMHMGDADPDDDHYLPHKEHWQSRKSDLVLPPYWFYFSAEGNDILNDIINAKHSIGIHVPTDVPTQLKNSSKDYFSKPTQTRVIKR
jgi:L-ascorbate metabolism protein UlaG (beta-lactamase superfamily)